MAKGRDLFAQLPIILGTYFRASKFIMRCAKGIFATGILGCTGFSLLQWEKGSETPSCDGEKGLRLPRSLGEHQEGGSVRPFSPSQEGVSDPFSHRKSENPVHPKMPLAEIPLAQRMTNFEAQERV